MTTSNTTNGWQYFDFTPVLTSVLAAGNWRESGNFYPREDL